MGIPKRFVDRFEDRFTSEFWADVCKDCLHQGRVRDLSALSPDPLDLKHRRIISWRKLARRMASKLQRTIEECASYLTDLKNTLTVCKTFLPRTRDIVTEIVRNCPSYQNVKCDAATMLIRSFLGIVFLKISCPSN